MQTYVDVTVFMEDTTKYIDSRITGTEDRIDQYVPVDPVRKNLLYWVHDNSSANNHRIFRYAKHFQDHAYLQYTKD
ncbi:hypothetical protein BX666DRAFT_1886573 [Dichotomocladium elegans]|nr:hypothetical protein BX666DRAFT_1886573 [Dichotomocladium elegans]